MASTIREILLLLERFSAHRAFLADFHQLNKTQSFSAISATLRWDFDFDLLCIPSGAGACTERSR
jgi:hypothetical protein